MSNERLTCAETAKLVRAALKKKFPGTKFSVRSDTYSMGASIDISWMLGPTTEEVNKVTGVYEGASFDGMNDLKSHQDAWLLPDGSAQLAYRPESYGGSVPGFVSDAPHPEAKIVSFGADFIHTARSYGSPWQEEMKLREQVALDMCILQQVPYTGENTMGLFGPSDREQVGHYAWRLLSHTSFAPGEVYAGVRFIKEGEDSGDVRIPFIILKKAAVLQPAEV